MDNERNGAQPANCEQLREPDLSYYLALRAQWQASKTRTETWEAALQTFHVELWARYGLAPQDGIDPRGRIERAPREAENVELDLPVWEPGPAEVQP